MSEKKQLLEESNLKDLILLTTAEMGLRTPAIIEKDYHVTQVIHALSDISSDYFALTFVGGTCLSKAYRLVDRMSEDCDFRIQQLPACLSLSKTKVSRLLKEFRHDILSTLDKVGYAADSSKIKVRDEGQYMRAYLPYESIYGQSQLLRPDIQLELIAINTRLPTQKKYVTTLIRNVLGDTVLHANKMVDCIHVSETAADKWVALTRRIANYLRRDAVTPEAALVRHLYDLYHICIHGDFNAESEALIHQIIQADQQRYKNHNDAYYREPLSEITLALNELEKNTVWRSNWAQFLTEMVFEKKPPTYEQAFEVLQINSNRILKNLEKETFTMIAPTKPLKSISYSIAECVIELYEDMKNNASFEKEINSLSSCSEPSLRRLAQAVNQLLITASKKEINHTSVGIRPLQVILEQITNSGRLNNKSRIIAPKLWTCFLDKLSNLIVLERMNSRITITNEEISPEPEEATLFINLPRDEISLLIEHESRTLQQIGQLLCDSSSSNKSKSSDAQNIAMILIKATFGYQTQVELFKKTAPRIFKRAKNWLDYQEFINYDKSIKTYIAER